MPAPCCCAASAERRRAVRAPFPRVSSDVLTRGRRSSGGGGIRTREGGSLPVGFQDRCNRPLCHPSGVVPSANTSTLDEDEAGRKSKGFTAGEGMDRHLPPA